MLYIHDQQSKKFPSTLENKVFTGIFEDNSKLKALQVTAHESIVSTCGISCDMYCTVHSINFCVKNYVL